MAHRLAVYLFYDKDGIVDEYVPFYLSGLRLVVSRIVVVCNGKLSKEGRMRLKSVADYVFCRENIGYDSWAYRSALEFIGWKDLLNYDELILTNNTIFGPIYPFSKMFNKMEKSGSDFWGIQRRFEDKQKESFLGKPLKYGFMPEFALSNFWVIRSRLLCSHDFKYYWDNLPEVKDYADTCVTHEPNFTIEMLNAGFSMDIYASEIERGLCPSPTVTNTYYQLSVEKLPILRRRTFTNPIENYLSLGYGIDAIKTLEFINKNTDYDINLIYDYLLRAFNQYDLHHRLQHNFIIPKYKQLHKNNAEIKIALLFHIYYEDCIKYCYDYALNFPDYTDFHITTTEELKEDVHKVFSEIGKRVLSISAIPNRGRDVSSLLIGFGETIRSYDYVCFAHSKKSHHSEWEIVGNEFTVRCFEAIMGSPEQIDNIINLFNDEPKIGMLAPMPPYHGHYYSFMVQSWSANYHNVSVLANKLKLCVDIDPCKPPIAPYGCMFWFRPKALTKLIDYDWCYDDFPEEPLAGADGTILHAIERIYPLIVQESGFFPAYMLSDEQARAEVTNFKYMHQEINRIVYNKNKKGFSFPEMIKSLQKDYYQPLPLQQINPEELLETISAKLMIKKIIKRILPKFIWKPLRKWRKIRNDKKAERNKQA